MNKFVGKLDSNSFEPKVLQANEPVLVDFWADWCGPCHALAPVLEGLAQEYDGRADIQKINVDDYPEIASKYGIRSLPTLVLFDQGKPVDILTGVQPRRVISELLEKVTH